MYIFGLHFRTKMIIYVSLLTLILSIMVAVNNWSVNRSSIFLSGLLLIISIFGLNQHFLATSRSTFWLAIVFNHFAPFWYLSGPLLYLYSRSVVQDEVRIYKTDIFHLLPFLIHLIGVLPYLFSPFEHKLWVAEVLMNDPAKIMTLNVNWLVPVKLNLIARPAIIILYCLYCFLYFRPVFQKEYKSASLAMRHQRQNFHRWYIAFTGILLAISINYLIAGFQFINAPAETGNIYNLPVALLSSGLIASLPVLLLVFPDVTYGLPKKRQELTSDEPLESIAQSDAIKLEENDAPDSYFKDIASRITTLFEKEELYLKPELSADDLAEKLKVPRHHIYYCLNTIIGTKFTTLKAQYRVRHAQKLLFEMDLNRFTIDSIGLQSGFSSRSSFYATFREITGITPSEFLVQNERNAASTSSATRND